MKRGKNMNKEKKTMQEQKREDIEINCLETFSKRLKETREKRGMTQSELAKAVGIKTEKINFAELNIKGRKIQIEELTKIAEKLNVLSSYLLGEIQTTTNNDNGLTDETNEIVKQWQLNDKLEILNAFILKLKKYNTIYSMDALANVTYIKKDILGSTLDNIKQKVKEQKDLSHNQTQKIRKLIDFIEFSLKLGGISDYTGLNFMVRNNKEKFNIAKVECQHLLDYNMNKSINIKFENIQAIEETLDQFIKYTNDGIVKEVMTDILEEIIRERIDDKNYYKKMKFKE